MSFINIGRFYLPIIYLCVVLIAALAYSSASWAARDTPSIASIEKRLKINRQKQKRFRSVIKKAAQKYRLDSALLHAVISVESAYNPNAVSHAGAMGLMQLMPATAARFGVDDPFNPTANIYAGARYLRILLNKFGTIQLALAAYNAGEGRVRRNRNTVPNIPETRKYIVSVIHFYMRYKRIGL